METKVNGLKISYEVAGSGPWLTLSHSLACDKHMWDEQMDALTQKYKVVRYDQRGHGQSEAPYGASTHAQHSEALPALVAALGTKRPHRTGRSLGGMTAGRRGSRARLGGGCRARSRRAGRTCVVRRDRLLAEITARRRAEHNAGDNQTAKNHGVFHGSLLMVNNVSAVINCRVA